MDWPRCVEASRSDKRGLDKPKPRPDRHKPSEGRKRIRLLLRPNNTHFRDRLDPFQNYPQSQWRVAQRLSFALKTPWSDGTSHLLLFPLDLLEKLAALVPPPRFHLRRYHGVLAPCARDRGRIVPPKPVEESTAADRVPSAPPGGHRLGWAALLARVFAADLKLQILNRKFPHNPCSSNRPVAADSRPIGNFAPGDG